MLDPTIKVGNGDYAAIFTDSPTKTMYIPWGEPTSLWSFGFGQITDWLYTDTYPNKGYFFDLLGMNPEPNVVL